MRGYGQFCPVAKACEVVTERWTPLVLRELLVGSRRFGELQRGVPLMSRSLLAARLRTLEESGVIESRPLESGHGREYRLTQAGEELRPVISLLGAWGNRWAQRRLGPEDLDASLLMWDIRRSIPHPQLPERRTTLRFDFDGVPRRQRGRRTWWLVLERPSVAVCLRDPGHPAVVHVHADLEAMVRVWLGDLGLADAEADGRIRFEGDAAVVRRLAGWLGLGGPRRLRRPWHATRSAVPSPQRA